MNLLGLIKIASSGMDNSYLNKSTPDPFIFAYIIFPHHASSYLCITDNLAYIKMNCLDGVALSNLYMIY